MNLQEFAALREGDRIVNEFNGSTGEGVVVDANKTGVRVRWGDNPKAPTFAYSVQGTAWFHWRKVDDEPQATNEATAPDAPQA